MLLLNEPIKMYFDLVEGVYGELSKHLSLDSEFQSKCYNLEKEKKYKELFEILLKENEKIFSKKEETILNFFILLSSIPNVEVEKIVETLISKKSDSKIRLNMYGNSFKF
jgi:hypothetical protein